MKVIGLCGGSGSGKGTVARLFAEYGFVSVDTDELYHRITSYMSPCLTELASAFGSDIIKDGRLFRPALRDKVFFDGDNSKEHALLNSITHKHIKTETEALIAKYRAEGAISVLIDAPLLYESGFDAICSAVIAVVADEEIRLGRIVSRDRIDREHAKKRIRSQISDEELIKKSDYVIVNNGDIDTLKASVRTVAEQILIN